MPAAQPDPRKTLIVLQGCLILLVLFFQLLKYRGPTVNRSVFYFTFANFGLQMSAFLVLPLDVLSIGTQTVDGQGEEAVKIYWEVFYWTNLLAGW